MQITRSARAIAIGLAILGTPAAFAQETQKKAAEPKSSGFGGGSQAKLRRDSDSVRSAFKPIVSKARASVVKIYAGDKQVALGTIVGPDGWIATKASQLAAAPICKLPDGKDYPAKIVGVDEENDIAMLRIDAHDLKVPELPSSAPLKAGQWAVSVGQEDAPISLGVVSGPIRRIQQTGRRPVLNIQLDDGDGGAKVVLVAPNGPAEKAGIKVNDIIAQFAGKPVGGREQLIQLIVQHKIGSVVEVVVRRGSETKKLMATLGDSDTATAIAGRPFDRQGAMNRMGGALSERRGRFPAAFQHDAVLKPEDCGGPVLDLKGRVIGMNISRTGRTESYAIPVDHLRGLMFDLMSGKLAPKSSVTDLAKETPKSKESDKAPTNTKSEK